MLRRLLLFPLLLLLLLLLIAVVDHQVVRCQADCGLGLEAYHGLCLLVGVARGGFVETVAAFLNLVLYVQFVLFLGESQLWL